MLRRQTTDKWLESREKDAMLPRIHKKRKNPAGGWHRPQDSPEMLVRSQAEGKMFLRHGGESKAMQQWTHTAQLGSLAHWRRVSSRQACVLGGLEMPSPPRCRRDPPGTVPDQRTRAGGLLFPHTPPSAVHLPVSRGSFHLHLLTHLEKAPGDKVTFLFLFF